MLCVLNNQIPQTKDDICTKATTDVKNHWTAPTLVCTHSDAFITLGTNTDIKVENIVKCSNLL